MAQLLITVVLTMVIFLVIAGLLLWAKKPNYRLKTENIIALLELVLEGRATDNDWRLFSAIPLRHDPYLDEVRDRCLEIEEREYQSGGQTPYLFSARGLEELAEILEELRQRDEG